MTIIQQAVTRLKTDGWTQGALERYGSGAMCIAGAIAAEAGVPMQGGVYSVLSELFPQELETLRQVIMKDSPVKYYHTSAIAIVVAFNDDAETTFEDVVAVMEEAEIRMGNIGEPVKTVEFEPMPEDIPVVEPAAPAVAPVEEPVPA